MIEPSPTTKIDPSLARAVLLEDAPEGGGVVKLSFPNTSYQVHLKVGRPVGVAPGKRVIGQIGARAKRIDRVASGGRFVEPVYGRPRRVQGRVIAIEPEAIVVDAGMPIHCAPTDPRQKAGDFGAGDFVSFDVLDGATFTPAAPATGAAPAAAGPARR